MKNIAFFILSLIFIFSLLELKAEVIVVDFEAKEKIKGLLLQKFGETQKFRIEKGVDQAASLWRKSDGTSKEFQQLCEQYFIGTGELLDENFKRLETNLEILFGHFNKISLDLKRPVDLDWGRILPLDRIFSQYNPSAHIMEDFFKNKIAFFVLLNFPHYSLSEKKEIGSKWNRKEWAHARMGDMFTSRVPAEIYQKRSQVYADASAYIYEYNLYMGKLVDKKFKAYFPEDLKLIAHWGLRDELKARYADPDGLFKQKIIYEIMLRIINQQIPEIVINNPEYHWNPFANKVYKDKKELAFNPEPLTRYKHFLNNFIAAKMFDPYYPDFPNHIKRVFEAGREMPEAEVEALFTIFISSPQVRKVGKLIQKRLGTKLRPFDIWYPGFKPRSAILNPL